MADDHQASSPICTIKMDINCCEKCPLKLERKLLKSTGVKSVAIDRDQGLVTVSGDIDPVKLLQMIKKMGKEEARIWLFQQEPDHDKDNDKAVKCSKRASNIKHGGVESDVNNEDGRHKCIPETMARKGHGQGSRSLHAMASNVGGYSYSRSLPQPVYRPTWPYHPSMTGGHRLITVTPPHGYYSRPPLPPGYPYFQPQSPPRANPMVHYTNYADNHSYI